MAYALEVPAQVQGMSTHNALLLKTTSLYQLGLFIPLLRSTAPVSGCSRYTAPCKICRYPVVIHIVGTMSGSGRPPGYPQGYSSDKADGRLYPNEAELNQQRNTIVPQRQGGGIRPSPYVTTTQFAPAYSQSLPEVTTTKEMPKRTGTPQLERGYKPPPVQPYQSTLDNNLIAGPRPQYNPSLNPTMKRQSSLDRVRENNPSMAAWLDSIESPEPDQAYGRDRVHSDGQVYGIGQGTPGNRNIDALGPDLRRPPEYYYGTIGDPRNYEPMDIDNTNLVPRESDANRSQSRASSRGTQQSGNYHQKPGKSSRKRAYHHGQSSNGQ